MRKYTIPQPTSGEYLISTGSIQRLGDHLGSTSITTDANGALTAEMRYREASLWDKACSLRCAPGVLREGETRYMSGATPTDYRYTSQREDASVGLYFYNARWYDPSLGRFAQADTIVPGGVQGLDRYAAMNNNPVRYIDPSGHSYCSSEYALKEDCVDNNKNEKKGLNFTGYSNWEIQILQKLYDEGGPNAQYGVAYIVEHGIHITVKGGWQSGFGSRGAWYEGDDLIVLNGNLKNPDGSPVYSLDKMPDEWGLANIIHEAKHIEQGPEIAFSKLGEMEAWQIGIDVAENLGYYQKFDWNPRDRDVKKAATVSEFSEAIWKYDKPYWVGLSLLPDYPLYFYDPCSMMVFCPNDRW